MNRPGSNGRHMKSMPVFFKGSKWWLSIAAGCVLTFARTSAQTMPTETPTAGMPTAVSSPTASPEATPSPTISPVERGRVLYPANAPQTSPSTVRGSGDPASMPGLATSFLMLLALCAGGYYLVRRQAGFAPVGKGQRKLVVSESRSLGNRQFLVVVEYENERVLLGVTPGKIDYLCPLPTLTTPTESAIKERVA